MMEYLSPLMVEFLYMFLIISSFRDKRVPGQTEFDLFFFGPLSHIRVKSVVWQILFFGFIMWRVAMFNYTDVQ